MIRRDRRGRFAAAPPPPVAPQPDPLRHPTEEHPRWRLRVFGLCWPWRASRREALLDALASRNARRDRDDRVIYLDCAAAIQRDPPFYVHGYVRRMRLAEERRRCDA